MMSKQRMMFGRSRTPPRARRRSDDPLASALRVARHFVADRWPALAHVEPTVTATVPQRPAAELLDRLGMHEAEVLFQAADGTAYTFTFASEMDLCEGVRAPLVAAVTVDSNAHIVKTSVSK